MSSPCKIVMHAAIIVAAIAILTGCRSTEAESPFVGRWRTVLDMPDGGLPFHIEVTEEDGALQAAVRNGAESLPFSSVEVDGDAVEFVLDRYDCWFAGEIDAPGRTITGEWRRRRGGEEKAIMGFVAEKGVADRFLPIESEPAAASPIAEVTGKWDMVFGEGDGAWRALAVLEQDGRRVTGTILTKVGDFRYLEGTSEKGTLRLSVFDGCHSFLVRAEARSAEALEGMFWFGKSGTPIKITAGGKEMPDPWSLTRIVNDAGTFSFSFPDVNGETVSNADARFRDRPLVVCVVGTWCCNCHDAGELLAELHEEYHAQGLEMVTLACEATGEFEFDAEMMRRFARLWDIDWPVLYIGPSSKKETAAALPDLNHFLSYPTTIFIDRRGKVRRIHTGFTGPGTGPYHDRMCAEFRAVIEEMLAE